MYLSHKYVHTTFFPYSFGSSSHARQRYQFSAGKPSPHGCRARHPSFQATQQCRREYVHLATIARDDDEDITRRSPRRSRAAARSTGRVMRGCDRRVDARRASIAGTFARARRTRGRSRVGVRAERCMKNVCKRCARGMALCAVVRRACGEDVDEA